jgi:DNA ligase D
MVAATNGSQSAARFQLASQSPVMAIGGFNGGDPSPTLAELQELVSNDRIHYFLAGDNSGGPGGGQGSGSQIASWVAENFTASTVDGVTLYDLTTSQCRTSRGAAAQEEPRYGARMAAERVEFEVGDRVVKISNPDRVYFSERGETKLDLARYYLSVADGIVNALYHRPCMLHRFPDGVDGEKVHQKRLPAGAPPWIETVRVHFPRFNRDADELCVNHPADVIWAVQMSTVEFHPWNSRRDDTESPDEWRIDLDPMPLATYADVRRVSVIAQEVLAELGAVGYPKTSGGKGLHIYVRIPPTHGFADVRRAAWAFAREVERRSDGMVDLTWWRKDRDPGSVFVDYNQNARDHTIASAYSVRGTPAGIVSAPVRWNEIADAEPADFTIATMPSRFADLGDLHADIDDNVYQLDELLEWADRDERDSQERPADVDS